VLDSEELLFFSDAKAFLGSELSGRDMVLSAKSDSLTGWSGHGLLLIDQLPWTQNEDRHWAVDMGRVLILLFPVCAYNFFLRMQQLLA